MEFSLLFVLLPGVALSRFLHIRIQVRDLIPDNDAYKSMNREDCSPQKVQF